MLPYAKKLTATARALRRSMTPEERHLWYDFLKKLPFTVRRQHNIEGYIVDFYIAARKTAIEIDGLQHTAPAHQRADAERDATLASWGISVLRYSNDDINRRFHTVAEDILSHFGISSEDLKDS